MRCEKLFELFDKKGFNFFSGVPDSTFKGWMKFLDENSGQDRRLKNIIAVNECEACAICSGYHLATGKPGVLYMQNSGLGKAVNPLTSLANKEVYSIPLLLMIGWRGKKDDQPQHIKMGKIMLGLLDLLEIPYQVLEDDAKQVETCLNQAKEHILKNKTPFGIIVSKGLIEDYESSKKQKEDSGLTREEVIRTITESLKGSEAVIATTGKTSRELFEQREKKGKKHSTDFLNVGSMGCSMSIAFSVAMQKPDKKVIVLDGDGSLLMQMGSLATIGHYSPGNLLHIIIDNGVHDSTGGQPTVSGSIDFSKMALACNYRHAETIISKESLEKALLDIEDITGPIMLVIKTRPGSRKDLGRPSKSPAETKKDFMGFLSR